MNLTSRQLFLLVFLGATGLILAALYFEHFVGLEPCPLCMMQRGAVILIGLSGLVAALHNPAGFGQKIYGLVTFGFTVLGMALAGRQLWLQSLPADQVPACGPGIDYMLEAFPILEVIEMSIRGTGDCAEVQWTFLGLSMPGWTMVAFVGFALVALRAGFFARREAASTK